MGGDRQAPLSSSKNRTNWNFSGEGAGALRAFLEFRKVTGEQSWKPHIIAVADAYNRAPFRFTIHLNLKTGAEPLSKRPKLRDEEVALFRSLPVTVNSYAVAGKVRSISHGIAEVCYQTMLDAVRLAYSDPDKFGNPEDVRNKLVALFEKHSLPLAPLLAIQSEEIADAA